jgi:hypothetical protein
MRILTCFTVNDCNVGSIHIYNTDSMILYISSKHEPLHSILCSVSIINKTWHRYSLEKEEKEIPKERP